MRVLCTLFLTALFGLTLHAQGVITRIGSDGTHFYYNGATDLQNVFEDATLNGMGVDTILFSGGVFQLTTELQITSPVVVVGSGIRTDSSSVYGGTTEINPSGNFSVVVIRNGADGTEIHGVTFGNQVRLGTNPADSDVDDVKFYRCNFGVLAIGDGGNNETLANGMLIEQCVIRDELRVQYSTDMRVRNSFLKNIGYTDANTNVDVDNCLIMNFTGSNSNGYINYVNSTFLTDATTLNVTGDASFTKCLFVGNNNLFAQNVSFAPSIITNVDPRYAAGLDVAFINVPNVPAGAGFTAYQFNGNYATTPIFSNAPYLGTDGLPRGIYGGEAPWKNGSLPFNPHWSLLTTPGNTSNGVLQGVHIKASAQEN